MSVINRKPFIKDVLQSLYADDAAELQNLVDGGEGSTLSKTLVNITNDDKGVHRCQLELKEGLFTGYLLYNDLHVVLIAYSNKAGLDVIELNLSKKTYKFVEQDLTIDELRAELEAVAHNPVVGDVKELSSAIIEKLKCGDIIVKRTGNAGHAYLVTYKEDKVGICMTYLDASTVETVSYDWDADQDKWVYNSTDKATLS